MSKVPIVKCLRNLIKTVASTDEAQVVIQRNGWCVRMCTNGCLKKAEARCSTRLCGSECDTVCRETGFPRLSQVEQTGRNFLRYK